MVTSAGIEPALPG